MPQSILSQSFWKKESPQLRGVFELKDWFLEMGFAQKPSNFQLIKDIRQKKDLKLKPCDYLKEGVELRYYQVVGCLHFLLLSRMILGDSAGLGKTIQTIAGYSFLLQKDPTLKLLVVTNKSAVNQWRDEFYLFSKGITVHALTNEYGKATNQDLYAPVAELRAKKIPYVTLTGFEARQAQYRTVKAQVLVCGYYPLEVDYQFLIENRSPNYIVAFDECQAFKNDETQAYFGAQQVSKAAQHVYGLSATIIKNKLEEAYNIFNIIVPGLFGSKEKFMAQYTNRQQLRIKRGNRFVKPKKIVSYKNLEEFRDTIEPFFLIRRTRQVESELPSLISKRIELEMCEKQAALYAEALCGDVYRRIVQKKFFEYKEKLDSQTEITDKEQEKLDKLERQYEESTEEDCQWKNKVASLSYLQMISNGPSWLEGEEGESSKEQEFKRLFEEELSTEKVIIFTRFESGIHRLEKILDDLELKHVKVTGTCKQADRDKARLDFQDPEKNVTAIIITFAGSAALNLQKANVLLFFDTPWSYGDLYQTIGRAQRIGSIHKHIYILHLVNQGTIDNHVLKVLKGKKELIADVMGDIAEGSLEFNKDKVMFQDDESTINALFDSVFEKEVK